MSSNDPGVPEYRNMAAMWAYGVGVYNLQLEEAVLQFQRDQLDSETRRRFENASKEERATWADHIAKATGVLTASSVWRMGLARNSWLNAAAQLLKCTVALQAKGVVVPQIRNQDLIRFLRDVDEHWEQVTGGRSLAKLRQTRPDEGPGRIEYNNKHVWIGGFNTLEILNWAMEVDKAVRKQAEVEGEPIPGIDQPLDKYIANHQPPD
jgi:hypothetical protein